MSDPVTLAAVVRSSCPLFTRFLSGFDDETRVRQAPGLPNHVSWTLGHLALTMHRAADLVVGFNEPQKLPTSDWIHGDGTAGDPSRYDTESVSYGSMPVSDASKYPRMTRATEIFEAAGDRLATEIASASPASLDREITWGGSLITVGPLINRIVFHNGTHAGQIIDLRRALGMPNVIG